jgi:ABC-2 type transport system permease protein
MSVVFWKELADHFSSLRFVILMAIILLLGVWAVYAAGQSIRQDVENVSADFAFLSLLTSQGGSLFSLATFLSLLGPLVGIMLGFDAISGEYARGTLSRVLSQPIYRDSFINGKFLAGLATVAVLWSSILFLVIGLGINLVGFAPNAEELWRMLIFTVVGIVYVGFWLALALLFSLLFQRTVTAALACLALWLFLTIFAPVISQIVAGSIMADPTTPEAVLRQLDIQNMLDRIISPATLYGETVQVVLNPMARGVGAALPEQTQGILLTPLQLRDSLLLILPQFTALIALVGVCFGICYIKFMRTEIRA